MNSFHSFHIDKITTTPYFMWVKVKYTYKSNYDLGKNYSYTYSCLFLPFKTFFLQKPHELLKLEKKIFKMSAVPLP